MNLFFSGISLLAVSSLLLGGEGFVQATNGNNLQGALAKQGNGPAAQNAGDAAPADVEVPQVAEEVGTEVEEPNHRHGQAEENVLDISKFENQDGVECKIVPLLEDSMMYIFTPTNNKPFTAIMDAGLTVVKWQRDVTYPAVARIQSTTVDFVTAEAQDHGFLQAKDRVTFFKKHPHVWKTSFGREVLVHLFKYSKKVTYFIGGENSDDDFDISTIDGFTRVIPHAHVFIQRVVYKQQVIFEFSQIQAQTVVGISVANDPKIKVELTLLYPLGGFHYTIHYTVTDEDRLHSPTQASKAIRGDHCDDCEKEAAASKEENEAKQSGFLNSTGLFTLAVPLLMMLTLA